MQTEKVIDHIVDWLITYAKEANMNGFVVGVSGGIDSAVTSTLCAKTGMQVLVLEMPIHQGKKQVTRADGHIDWLQGKFDNLTRQHIDLTPVFDGFKATLPPVADEDHRNMSLANTRARLRMTTLYYFAALKGYLVAGTGNKVEDFGVGFYTKYGDGGVDLSPIADLLKTEVYKVGETLGINKDIMQAPPTDGLWGDHRTDEQQIGATYPELEWAMKMDDLGKKSEDFSDREKEVFTIYKTFNTTNKHKMIPIPICHIPHNLKW